jgi:hypothetical protein
MVETDRDFCPPKNSGLVRSLCVCNQPPAPRPWLAMVPPLAIGIGGVPTQVGPPNGLPYGFPGSGF